MGLVAKKGPAVEIVTKNVTVHLSRELAEELLTALTDALDTATLGKTGVKGKKGLTAVAKGFKNSPKG